MNFEYDFFDSIVNSTLFYSPKIAIKPVHIANGLFRAVCGLYADNENQHEVIHPQKNVQRNDVPRAVREILPKMFGADNTVYGKANFSSYTLSHVTHITSDNHDRGAGEWLHAILERGGEESLALHLLHDLLTEEESKRSDELSTLTIPISSTKLKPLSRKLMLSDWPTSLAIDETTGKFVDPLLCSIKTGFGMLAQYDAPMARYGGKLDALRRLTLWSCLALYLHLANTGREDNTNLVPILFCMDAAHMPTLKQSSIQTYQWVNRSVDRFFRYHIREKIRKLAEQGVEGRWDDDQVNEQRARSMQWKAKRGGTQSERPNENNVQDFLNFYYSYRNGTANQPPLEAFANAATDLLDRFLSSSPNDVARLIGMRIGLLTSSSSQRIKLYTPEADFLEVLVRASVPPKEYWPLQKLAQYWADQYGILFGALGDENQRLAQWGVSAVAGNEYLANSDRLIDILEWCGYAHRYADGVVMISVQELE